MNRATYVLLAAAVLAASPQFARADGGCSAEEIAAAKSAVARGEEAQRAGKLDEALKYARANGRNGCAGSGGDALFASVIKAIATRAEAAGQLTAAFDYFNEGGLDDDAKRVGMKAVRAKPADVDLSRSMLGFMTGHGYATEAQEIRNNAQAQATRLLAAEDKAFGARTPQLPLLREARAWLELAGDSVAAPVTARAIKRGDFFAAQDHAFALEQALAYYDFAGAKDKAAEVRSKARRLADGLAGGDNWAEAAQLYIIAGDDKRAEQLEASRRAGAARQEEARQKKFSDEQADLEKELGL